jgi:hypothetical protein
MGIALLCFIGVMLLVVAADGKAKKGRRFSESELQRFAADLRRELYSRATLSGEQSEPGRIPAILERLRGMAAVAVGGFEAVSPILDALRSVIS